MSARKVRSAVIAWARDYLTLGWFLLLVWYYQRRINLHAWMCMHVYRRPGRSFSPGQAGEIVRRSAYLVSGSPHPTGAVNTWEISVAPRGKHIWRTIVIRFK